MTISLYRSNEDLKGPDYSNRNQSSKNHETHLWRSLSVKRVLNLTNNIIYIYAYMYIYITLYIFIYYIYYTYIIHVYIYIIFVLYIYIYIYIYKYVCVFILFTFMHRKDLMKHLGPFSRRLFEFMYLGSCEVTFFNGIVIFAFLHFLSVVYSSLSCGRRSS